MISYSELCKFEPVELKITNNGFQGSFWQYYNKEGFLVISFRIRLFDYILLPYPPSITSLKIVQNDFRSYVNTDAALIDGNRYLRVERIKREVVISNEK